MVQDLKYQILQNQKKWTNINENSLTNRKPARTLFSTIIDAKYGIILDSILGKSDSSERDLLQKHIKNIENLVNLNKVILILDADYYSLELKLFLEKQDIKYIFRLGFDVYKKEISQMKSIDENLKINNTTPRRLAISDPNLLKKAKQLPYIEARVIKLPINQSKQ